MTPDTYTLRPQSLTDLRRADLLRQAERIARILARRQAELDRIAARIAEVTQ